MYFCVMDLCVRMYVFFFNQKTAYEMRISDWSSDVCSSDLGAAAGLGCDMALSCDFVIAADTAQLCMTYIHRGLIPDRGGMYFLPRRVGLARATELIFSRRRVAAAEALAIAMNDRVAETDALLAPRPEESRRETDRSSPVQSR